jgi:translocation and assembly module TamB
MNWKRKLLWVAAGLVVLTILLFAGGYWFLQTSSFQRYAISKIGQQVQDSTGARLEVQHLALSLRTLTADLYGVTLHGVEPVGQPPLLQADRMTVRLKITSVLQHKISLDELLIVHPVAHLTVDENGKSNLPTPPPSSKPSSGTNVFDLAVRHALLSSGEAYVNDRQTPFAADVRDLKIESHFEALRKAYVGSIDYSNADLQYGHYRPLGHALEVRFTATPSQLTVDPLNLRVASSSIALKARVQNYSEPDADGTYELHLHAPDVARFVNGTKLDGDITMSGPMRYHNAENGSLLQALDVSGRVASDGLTATTPEGGLVIRKLLADYHLAQGQLRSDDISADLLNGHINAGLLVRHLDGIQEGTATVKLETISLEAVKRTVQSEQLKRLPITGTLTGDTRASWTGSLQNAKVISDLALRGAIWETNPPSPRFPLDGVAHVSYDGKRNAVLVSRTSFRAASVSLNVQGELSNHSNLQIGTVAPDLHEAAQLISLLKESQSPPPKQVDVSGSATVHAIVQGSMQRPRISGTVSAENLEAHGSRWKTARLAFEANPSSASVHDLALANARQGDASGNVRIVLRDWSYVPENRIEGNLTAHRLAIADLQHLAGVDYPVVGNLSANVAISGSQLDPAGHGQLQISEGKAYGEPFQSVNAKFDAASGTIHSTVNASLPAGSAQADLRYTPKTKAYTLQASAPSIVLEKLATVQQKNLGLTGTAKVFANGQGTVDDPQLTANFELPKLQLKRTAITGIKANLDVANQKANVTLSSDISQAHVQARGYVNLTPDRYADFKVDTNRVPLEPFMVLYSPSVPEGFQGETELHASLKGPLSDKSKLEAHLTVTTLKGQYQNLQIESSAPIRADYSHAQLTLQPAELKGSGTSIHWQGTLSESAMNVTANGSVDAHIARMVQPDINSGGTVTFEVRASGTPKAPELKGQAHFQNVALVTPDAPLGIEKLNGDVDVDGQRAQLRNLTAQVGGGQVTLGGTVEFRPAMQFNVALNGDSIRLRYPTGVRTVLDSKLMFNGNMQASNLTGNVLIDSVSFTPEFDLSSFATQFGGTSTPSTGETFADKVKLQIAVQSAQNLSANSTQLSLEGTANLRVIGTAAEPVIVGRADMTSGELFFRNNRYQVQRGLVTFNNPTQTEAFLNVAATTTIQQYNLTITMNGPVEKLNTSYVSDPPLATADVINLIASGQTTQEASANSSADSILAGQVASQFSGNIQKLAGISSLQIDPLIGGNNQNPSARVAVQQRLTKNLLFTFSTDVSQPGNEIIQGDYQINRRWSVSVARDQLGGVSIDGRYHTKF